MTQRTCVCPRKEPMDGMRSNAIWFSRACAVRWARENPGKSLYDARNPNRTRTRARSGPQVSLHRAIEAGRRLALTPIPPSPQEAREAAEAEMRRELSDRQREQLEARTERKAA
jgi:hypothetical protein